MQKIEIKDGVYQGQHYYLYGNGSKYLLLIHGYAETASIFNTLLPLLNKEYTIILPNLPGTEHTKTLEICSIAAMADYCLWILQQHCTQPCAIAGHSMGGYITLDLVNRYPSLFHSFALINSHCYADDEQKKIKRQQAIELVQQGKRKQVLENLIHSAYSNHFKDNYMAQVEEHIVGALTLSDDAVVYYNTAMMQRDDLRNVLTQSKVPVLITVGGADVTHPIKELLLQCTFAAQTQILWLPNCGHNSMREEPVRLAEALNKLFNHHL